MVTKVITSGGKTVWRCDICKRRRKTEAACKAHEANCTGRVKKKKYKGPLSSGFSGNYVKAERGYICSCCGANVTKIYPFGNNKICKTCLDGTAKKFDGMLYFEEYKKEFKLQC